MREIKFRAWDTCENKFINDVLVHKSFCGIPEDANGGSWVVTQKLKRWNIEQFTGMLDTNGTEIYEGDVVRIKGDGYYGNDSRSWDNEWEFIGRAVFSSFGWYFENVNAWIPFMDIINDEISGEIEIIGNIHENPHLLNAKVQ